MNRSQTKACAEALIEAARSRLPYQRMHGSLDDAYAAQRQYVELAPQRLGCGPPVGYKIALTTRAMQTLVGVDAPLYGRIFAARVHADGAAVDLSEHQHIGVEFEVALRLGQDLPLASATHTRESVSAAVDGMAVAYELVEDRHADYTQINAFSLVADNAWNAGVIVGEYKQLDLPASAATSLVINGEAAGQGQAGDALGHPLEALAWLANALAERGEWLRAGEIVMTGSSIRTTFPMAGDRYVFSVAGLGSVRASFA